MAGRPASSVRPAQSLESSQLRTILVGGQNEAGLHSPKLVPASLSTLRQHTSPVVPQNTPLSPQRTWASGSVFAAAGSPRTGEQAPLTHVCVASQPKPMQSLINAI